jgi:rare lipoprotein A
LGLKAVVLKKAWGKTNCVRWLLLPTVSTLLVQCKPTVIRSGDPSPQPENPTPIATPFVPAAATQTPTPKATLPTVRPTPQKTPEPKFTKIACGEASYYGNEFAGSPTATGEIYNPNKLTAAHLTLSFETQILVTSSNKVPKSISDGVVVRINDRGPYAGGRIIDLSEAAFRKLGSVSQGVMNVCLYRTQ